MVVLGHLKGAAIQDAISRGHAFAHPSQIPFAGGAGVDLFFLVSGFIIVHISRRRATTRNAATSFLARRLARVAPLYWAVSVLTLVLAVIDRRPIPTDAAIAASLAFIPYDTWGTGEWYPFVSLGWTLNYEVAFYLVFAASIAVARQHCVLMATSVLGIAAAVGLIWPAESGALQFWTQPIVLEFAAGMLLAEAHERRQLRLHAEWRLLLLAAGIGLYVADPFGLFLRDVTDNGLTRVCGWGVPAALLLLAAIAGPFQSRSLVVRTGLTLGDASFALYLLHPFAIAFCRRVIPALPVTPLVEVCIFCSAGFLLAVAGSVAANQLIERRLTAWLNARLVHWIDQPPPQAVTS